ncbi:LytR/AlgR family response regulator transcription factor [Carnobacterium maltaromaticum]|uniref:LytR/AlgR family response regulator transcription factor n=1 Tax=Carnobacterium maltaromaticum TaxID=2751 RepID=UPI0010729416|nr:LytTR family DNA-binding domain-containing protein [Carnobacterium maltaromaticum]TFJ76090.1 DNA-binding response regulator [Carnobacterium maltaromaticum]TFJ79031.1 DNA-binding response regulator [Carnobacterium maltaromaticum]
MIKVAICDDIPQMAHAVEELLVQYDQKLFDSNIFYYPKKLLKDMESTEFDLFILDIEFPETTGIDLAKNIRQKNANVPIIFLTNYREYMEEVFKVQTFDYIIKPVTKKILFPVLDQVVNYLGVTDAKFTFSYNKIVYSLNLSDIVYFEKNRRQVTVYTSTRSYVANMSNNEIITQVSDNFVQIHTSFIINMKHIKEVGNYFLLLNKEAGTTIKIPISRKYKETARDKILMNLRHVL